MKSLFTGNTRVTILPKYTFLVLFDHLPGLRGSDNILAVPVRCNIARLECHEDTILSSKGIANKLGRNGNGKETETCQERQDGFRLERKGNGYI